MATTSFFNPLLLGTMTIALVDKLADATKHSYPRFSRITSTLFTIADHGLRVTAGFHLLEAVLVRIYAPVLTIRDAMDYMKAAHESGLAVDFISTYGARITESVLRSNDRDSGLVVPGASVQRITHMAYLTVITALGATTLIAASRMRQAGTGN